MFRFLYGDDFREVAEERKHKDHWLRRCQSDGYQAIDAVHEPIARHTHEERAAIIGTRSPALVAEAAAIAPAQILLVKKSVHDGLAEPFRAAGLPVVNEGPVPFPGRGQQGRFFRTMEGLVEGGRLVL